VRLLMLLCLAVAAAAAPKKDEIVAGKVGEILDRHMSRLDSGAGGFCGSVLVAKDGKILINKGYGLADAKAKKPIPADAMWDWASVTKQFTAAAILRLEMKRKLKIEDSIRKYFKQAPKDKQKVKILHLLNHTSGIQSDDRSRTVDWRSRDAMVRYALNVPLKNEPGKKWEYSNLAYFLLAALIEKVGGTTYERYCIKNLFRPAGMKEACFIGSPGLDLARVPLDARGTGVPFAYGTTLNWGYKGSGGAVATPREMLLWDRALRGNKILSKKAKKKYYTPGLNNYALGWFIEKKFGDLRYQHGGAVGKTVAYYLRIIDDDIVVALAHSERPPTHPETTAAALARIAKTGRPAR
jgi:CubicO group peptidase (beta-lactamase class C family)